MWQLYDEDTVSHGQGQAHRELQGDSGHAWPGQQELEQRGPTKQLALLELQKVQKRKANTISH